MRVQLWGYEMTACNASTRRQETHLLKRTGLKKLIDEGYLLRLIWFSSSVAKHSETFPLVLLQAIAT